MLMFSARRPSRVILIALHRSLAEAYPSSISQEMLSSTLNHDLRYYQSEYTAGMGQSHTLYPIQQRRIVVCP